MLLPPPTSLPAITAEHLSSLPRESMLTMLPYTRLPSSTSSSSALRPGERPSKSGLRRSPSSTPHPDTLEGQNKDSKSKKAGRYADVIDTWDPTGLGSASKLFIRRFADNSVASVR